MLFDSFILLAAAAAQPEPITPDCAQESASAAAIHHAGLSGMTACMSLRAVVDVEQTAGVPELTQRAILIQENGERAIIARIATAPIV